MSPAFCTVNCSARPSEKCQELQRHRTVGSAHSNLRTQQRMEESGQLLSMHHQLHSQRWHKIVQASVNATGNAWDAVMHGLHIKGSQNIPDTHLSFFCTQMSQHCVTAQGHCA